jgi:hypothetical protein
MIMKQCNIRELAYHLVIYLYIDGGAYKTANSSFPKLIIMYA